MQLLEKWKNVKRERLFFERICVCFKDKKGSGAGPKWILCSF
jgi:hypothetical protein